MLAGPCVLDCNHPQTARVKQTETAFGLGTGGNSLPESDKGEEVGKGT
jgi:hypothetical protein